MQTYFAVVGVLCLMLAAWLSARRLRAQFFGAVASGTVAGHETRESDDSISYLPVVIYIDAAGKRHQFTSVAGGVTKLPVPGTRVTIRYLPSAPEIAYVSGFLHMWSAPVALFVLGVAGISAAWQP
ncbi:MAG: DUF3592 domain-containing protein [Burkholderiaceae bacterium]|nr:DUF3592 domain-containing protein [Burkholderiaceae bacterium]